MGETGHRLADRLGKTAHVSPLRFKLRTLQAAHCSSTSTGLEDWLIDVANSRGARIVFREAADADHAMDIPPEQLSNEELVVAICQLQCEDRPQMLRLAAQLISRMAVDLRSLCRVAERERVGPVLAALADLALKVEPGHKAWQAIRGRFADERPLRDVLLHWTRVAEPVMTDGRCNARAWRLVA
jgi:hypothetical protein